MVSGEYVMSRQSLRYVVMVRLLVNDPGRRQAKEYPSSIVDWVRLWLIIFIPYIILHLGESLLASITPDKIICREICTDLESIIQHPELHLVAHVIQYSSILDQLLGTIQPYLHMLYDSSKLSRRKERTDREVWLIITIHETNSLQEYPRHLYESWSLSTLNEMSKHMGLFYLECICRQSHCFHYQFDPTLLES